MGGHLGQDVDANYSCQQIYVVDYVDASSWPHPNSYKFMGWLA